MRRRARGTPADAATDPVVRDFLEQYALAMAEVGWADCDELWDGHQMAVLAGWQRVVATGVRLPGHLLAQVEIVAAWNILSEFQLDLGDRVKFWTAAHEAGIEVHRTGLPPLGTPLAMAIAIDNAPEDRLIELARTQEPAWDVRGVRGRA